VLLLLGASQGASYLFIRVAVRELSPPALMEIRLLFAAPILVAYCVARGHGRELRASHALHYAMVSWHGASRSVLLTYVTPVFALLLGAWFLGEQTTLPKLAGLALIVAGVALGAGIGVASRGTRLAQGA
jgi:drug/metabolite transporter (DMT)-like permease